MIMIILLLLLLIIIMIIVIMIIMIIMIIIHHMLHDMCIYIYIYTHGHVQKVALTAYVFHAASDCLITPDPKNDYANPSHRDIRNHLSQQPCCSICHATPKTFMGGSPKSSKSSKTMFAKSSKESTRFGCVGDAAKRESHSRRHRSDTTATPRWSGSPKISDHIV